jgi:F-type H+-transporting ATPase subunit a
MARHGASATRSQRGTRSLALQRPVSFIDLLAGGRIPPVLLGTWIVMGILLLFAFAARSALASASDPMVPDEGITLRTIAESIVEAMDGMVSYFLGGHDTRKFVTFFGTLFVFILVANLIGLIPGMEPPTSDSDLTFALGTICFAFYLVQGFKAHGIGYLKHFLGPMLILIPLMLPIEIADNLARPFSLGIRLFANMFADHQVMQLFTGLTYLIIPLAFYALGLLVCVVQAAVFVLLAITYVRLAAVEHH